MFREVFRVPTLFGMRFAQATITGDTLALHFPQGTSPSLQRHLKKKLVHLYKKRCASFGIVFECWRDCGKLYVQLKRKRTIMTALVEVESALSSSDKLPRDPYTRWVDRHYGI